MRSVARLSLIVHLPSMSVTEGFETPSQRTTAPISGSCDSSETTRTGGNKNKELKRVADR